MQFGKYCPAVDLIQQAEDYSHMQALKERYHALTANSTQEIQPASIQ